ncbi:MAG TPA: LPS assembly protein LptD [Chthoniobacter sp.]|nr:LPS assembly protein LptD [Chthoniobacter sp.]
MKRLLYSFALLLLGATGAWAQFSSFGDVPIEITSESTRMENGLAIADRDVIIHYKDTMIYCDYAQYNPDTRDVFLTGDVRIYREGHLFTAERAIYNLETKILSTADFRGDVTPFEMAGESLSTLSSNSYLVKDGLFTTSDNSKPDWYLRSKTVRIYPKDRVVFSNVTLYVGKTPVFWYPYLYQSLNADQSFTFTPGYYSVWGAFLMTQYTFPLSDTISGKFRLDLYSERGVGIGFEARWGAEKRSATPFAKATETRDEKQARAVQHGENWGHFLSYYVSDTDPGENKTALAREPINPNRYRVSLQDRTFLDPDLYSTINITKLSDARFLQDFEPGEFRENPNPDSMVAVTKWSENYSAILMARKQINKDFDGTEKLPEFALDVKRQPIFDGPIFYDSETSAGMYKRAFADGSLFPDYKSFRADTYHQLSRPGTYFGWLSLNPHVGVRGTFYENSGYTQDGFKTIDQTTTVIGPDGLPMTVKSTTQQQTETLVQQGSLFRAAVTAGFEASFKFSKAYEGVQSRTWGLDGLRHIVEPYMDASFVYTNHGPESIYQFDRFVPSTQVPPIDFPQFNAVDSLDNWSIVRLGIRNRFQTRRDNSTLNWLELNTYFDVNIDRPDFGNPALLADTGTFSNVYNSLKWSPLPWLGLTIDSQFPLLDKGFTQVNSSLGFQVSRDLTVNIGERYINGNTQFQNSNLLTFGGYYRINDNWSFSFGEQYEFETSTLEAQTYQISRDLSSWIASFGFSVMDNGGKEDVGLIITFTLKDLPSVRLPVNFDPSTIAGQGGSK